MSETVAQPSEPLGQDSALLTAYGFVPNLFRVQGQVPLLIEAEANLINAVVTREDRLSRQQKETILFSVADARANDYCRTLYGRAGTSRSGDDTAILNCAIKLARHTPWYSRNDVEVLRRCGFDDAGILEIVATTALGQMLCTLADGL